MKLLVAVLVVALAGLPVLAAADPLRPPDGTYRYELRHEGTVAGASTVIFRSAGGVLTVDDDSHITLINVSAHASARHARSP